jgi:hypothetical protein
MARSILIAIVLLLASCTAASEEPKEFAIGSPQTAARLTIPCWLNKQATAAFQTAEFSPVVQGILVEKSDPTRSLFTVWLHTISGRAAIVVSNVSGEECIVLLASEAQ